MRIDAETLKRLWPRAPESLVEAVANHSAPVFAKYGITTRLRAVHFLAQISHESDGGTIREEDLEHYSAVRITEVWPRRFESVAEAEPYAHNARRLADRVYGDRMGNRPGTDDGFNYRGRGLLQITGRDSYRRIGQLTDLPLEDRPELAAAPDSALEVAACEFKKLGCLPFCDRDNIEGVTRRVNGGYIGLASRKAWLAKWKRAFPAEDEAADPAPAPVPLPEPAPKTIPRGSDDSLPPVVEAPDHDSMSKSKTGWAAVIGTIAALSGTLGQAVDALKPLLADPHTVMVAAVVCLGAGAFIWFDRKRRMGIDNV